MKLVKSLAIFAFALTASTSFAAAKNLVVCPWNDQDDEITIRQDAGGQVVALFSMVDHGTTPFSVVLVPVGGKMGAGLIYEGAGLYFHVNTDVPPKNGSFTADLSIKSLGITNEKFDCQLK